MEQLSYEHQPMVYVATWRIFRQQFHLVIHSFLSRKSIKAFELLWAHVPGPLLFAANGDDFSGGNIAFPPSAHVFRIPTETSTHGFPS